MENIMVAAVYLSDKYTYTIKKTSNIVGSFRKKKSYYFTAKRYSLWNKFTEFSSVDLQKRKKKKEKKMNFYIFSLY